jgi:hypothetical protein
MEHHTEPIAYEAVVEELAGALCRTWHACAVPGANLPEALSYALGLAARTLAAEVDAGCPAADELDQELATAILVGQRPGSWEAAAVANLAYPVELLSPASAG